MNNRLDLAYSNIRWFEDFAIGETFEYGHWVMKKEEMLSFAKMYDPEPFHLDENEAIRMGWGGLIASGLQVVAVCRRLQTGCLPNAEVVISPGWDGIRWFKPVFAKDILSCRIDVIDTRELESRPTEGVVKLRNQMINQDDEVVAEMISNVFIRRRPPGRSL